MARKKGSKDYPLEIKLEAVRLWEEEDLSYKAITERLAIRDPKRVKEWMRLYRKEGKAGLKKLFPDVFEEEISFCCDSFEAIYKEVDSPLTSQEYDAGEYSFRLSGRCLDYCPWCGKQLS